MDGAKRVILCVDDDPEILEVLRMVLEKAGFAVDTAASKEEGLAAFGRRRPDAMVVDLMMEDVDAGIGLLQAVRALGPVPPTYLLSSAGDALADNIDRSEVGVVDILQKPVNHADIVRLLNSQLKPAT